jgi:hypothetical protein
MHHPKKGHRVRLKLAGGKVEEGVLYVYDNERVLDLLNDERAFIPFFSQSDRSTWVVNKDQIAYVHSLE